MLNKILKDQNSSKFKGDYTTSNNVYSGDYRNYKAENKKKLKHSEIDMIRGEVKRKQIEKFE